MRHRDFALEINSGVGWHEFFPINPQKIQIRQNQIKKTETISIEKTLNKQFQKIIELKIEFKSLKK